MADFGEILQNIGEFGLFQKLNLFALSYPNAVFALVFSSVIFVPPDPEQSCNTNWILRADANLSMAEQLNLTLPREQDGTFSKCLMYVPVDWDIDAIREYGLNETTGCQDRWVYNNTLYDSTIVTSFDLVCAKANLVGAAQSVLMGGILAGCLLFGPLAESFGRRRAAQSSVVLMLIFCVTTALCPNIYLYLASQFMVGISFGGIRVNCLILAMEWIGVSKRSWATGVTMLCGSFGQCAGALMVYFIRNWRLAQLITASQAAVVFIYIWFIPDSALWLLNKGRTEEAKTWIVKVAAINKQAVPESLLERITEKQPEEEPERKGGVCVLMRSAVLRKYFFTLILACFSMNLSYFCLSFNVGKFGLSVFLTALMFGITDIPAQILCIWLLEVLGRKISLMSTLLIGGLMSFLIIAVPQGNAIAVTTLAVSARFFISWSGTLCYVYAQELFPTSLRQTGVGLGALSSRVGSMVSPLVNMLATYHWSVPIVIFGSFTMFSGALCYMLPETRGIALPDSVDEAEANRNRTTVKNLRDSNEPQSSSNSTRL
ncbi:solute carrier family 22 member 13-like [Genypterus blacodes]|uniref:solute carrier family 22 member 13-like n=1 Tax=Genypterus blacodes TaxID=154954 RepID=UPI003F760F2E